MTREELDAAGDWAFPARHTPEHTPGMTLRDYFAAQAMNAIQSRYDHLKGPTAVWAYEIADAMLKARSQ